MNTKNILITGSRAPVALDLIRNLARSGYNVICADSINHPLSRYSNYCRSFKVSSPRNETEKYINELVFLCKMHHISWIIPTCEEIFYLSKYKSCFEGVADVFVEDFDKMKTLHSKWDFIKLLESLGKEAPKSWLITNQDELKKVSLRPMILKPVFSRFGSNIHIINENTTLPKIDASDKHPWIAQEYLEGKVWCSYSVARNGKVALHTNYSSNFKVGQGASIHFQHVEVPFIENWVRTFVSEINFTGQIAFDFIQIGSDKYVPIECNPRATSGIHLLFTTPGFIDSFLHEQTTVMQPKEGTSAALKLPMCIYGISSISSIQGLKKWMYAMKSKDIVFDTKDPIPAFHQLVTFLEFFIRGRKLGISPISASTHDIEFNGEL